MERNKYTCHVGFITFQQRLIVLCCETEVLSFDTLSLQYFDTWRLWKLFIQPLDAVLNSNISSNYSLQRHITRHTSASSSCPISSAATAICSRKSQTRAARYKHFELSSLNHYRTITCRLLQASSNRSSAPRRKGLYGRFRSSHGALCFVQF